MGRKPSSSSSSRCMVSSSSDVDERHDRADLLSDLSPLDLVEVALRALLRRELRRGAGERRDEREWTEEFVSLPGALRALLSRVGAGERPEWEWTEELISPLPRDDDVFPDRLGGGASAAAAEWTEWTEPPSPSLEDLVEPSSSFDGLPCGGRGEVVVDRLLLLSPLVDANASSISFSRTISWMELPDDADRRAGLDPPSSDTCWYCILEGRELPEEAERRRPPFDSRLVATSPREEADAASTIPFKLAESPSPGAPRPLDSAPRLNSDPAAELLLVLLDDEGLGPSPRSNGIGGGGRVWFESARLATLWGLASSPTGRLLDPPAVALISRLDPAVWRLFIASAESSSRRDGPPPATGAVWRFLIPAVYDPVIFPLEPWAANCFRLYSPILRRLSLFLFSASPSQFWLVERRRMTSSLVKVPVIDSGRLRADRSDLSTLTDEQRRPFETVISMERGQSPKMSSSLKLPASEPPPSSSSLEPASSSLGRGFGLAGAFWFSIGPGVRVSCGRGAI